MRNRSADEQITRSAAAARAAMGSAQEGADHDSVRRDRDHPMVGDQAFLDHYFKRINPRVAASFSEVQKEAIKTMFGARGINTHAVDIRHGVVLGRQRFYMVLLLGREQRSFPRADLASRGMGFFTFLAYLVLVALVLATIFGLVYFARSVWGVEVAADQVLESGATALRPGVWPPPF